MKVGDLIKYESVMNDDMDYYTVEYGMIIQLSKTGKSTNSALVMFNDGKPAWISTERLIVITKE